MRSENWTWISPHIVTGHFTGCTFHCSTRIALAVVRSTPPPESLSPDRKAFSPPPPATACTPSDARSNGPDPHATASFSVSLSLSQRSDPHHRDRRFHESKAVQKFKPRTDRSLRRVTETDLQSA
ncbi:hypothetical protein FCV25MIE_05935 [Fagus crenata]